MLFYSLWPFCDWNVCPLTESLSMSPSCEKRTNRSAKNDSNQTKLNISGSWNDKNRQRPLPWKSWEDEKIGILFGERRIGIAEAHGNCYVSITAIKNPGMAGTAGMAGASLCSFRVLLELRLNNSATQIKINVAFQLRNCQLPTVRIRSSIRVLGKQNGPSSRVLWHLVSLEY